MSGDDTSFSGGAVLSKDFDSRQGKGLGSSSDAGTPLMPKAVAVWLVENTSLTFDQISNFCNIHRLEVQAVADGEVSGVAGCNPITMGQTTKEEIELCQKDPNRPLALLRRRIRGKSKKSGGGTRFTPMARRKDKPDAICWLLKNCPELSDLSISRLIGTTKNTIDSIRSKVHWNMSNIKPRDPVLLELCSQVDLDEAVLKAKMAVERKNRLGSIVESGGDGDKK